MKKHPLYIFLFITSFAYSQQGQDIIVEVDNTKIKIGEQLQYKITVNIFEDVVFPKMDSLGMLEVVSSSKVETFQNKLIKKYHITGFDSGSFYIPKQKIFIQNRSYFTDSILISIADVAVDTIKQKPFPIKSILDEPLIFDDFRPYLIWLYLALGIILLVILIYYFFKKYYRNGELSAKNIIPAYEEALQKLSSLDKKQLWQNNKTKEYYIELTEIIRIYTGRELKIQTLEATTDELIQLTVDQNKNKKIGIPKESISKLEEFLQHADFVKFAKFKPLANEIEVDRKVAEEILERLHIILKQYEQDNLLS